jgi:hypothetical protein
VTESSKEDDTDFLPWFSQECRGGSILQPVDPWTTDPSDSLHYWVRFRVLTASMKMVCFLGCYAVQSGRNLPTFQGAPQ